MNIHLLKKNRKAILIILDSATIAFSVFLSFLLRFDFTLPDQYKSDLILLLVISVFIQTIVFNIKNYYDIIWRFTSIWDMLNIFKAITFSSLFSIVFIAFYKGVFLYPRTVLLMFYFLNVFFICFTRLVTRIYHSHIYSISRKNNKEKKSLILIGAGKTGEKITREIKTSPDTNYNIIGLVDDEPSIQGATIHGIKVVGTVKDIPKLNIIFDEILITAPSASGDQLRNIVLACKATGKKYKTVPSLTELIDRDVSLATVRNVSYVDLLGRKEVKLDHNSIEDMMFGKRVLITGAGGSIGSELVRQCLIFHPAEIICIDHSEENIFNLENELSPLIRSKTILKYYLCTINSKAELNKIFNENRPQIIFHAAAYKHVPIQENHPWSAVKTNVGGTLNMVNLSDQYGVDLFVLVSTDKAVNPVNIMGASKRVAEKIIQSFNSCSKTCFMAVRFGNVLGSSGSAIPIFEKQINKGGPITITHPEMTRYFMSIQEASQLILQCGAIGKEGEIFLLEMGKPVKILQMAKDLVRLSGLEPEIDVPIVFSGLRPGEKLYEELQLKDEIKTVTNHKKIMILKGRSSIEDWNYLLKEIEFLLISAEEIDSQKIYKYFKRIVPTFNNRSLETDNKSLIGQFKVQA